MKRHDCRPWQQKEQLRAGCFRSEGRGAKRQTGCVNYTFVMLKFSLEAVALKVFLVSLFILLIYLFGAQSLACVTFRPWHGTHSAFDKAIRNYRVGIYVVPHLFAAASEREITATFHFPTRSERMHSPTRPSLSFMPSLTASSHGRRLLPLHDTLWRRRRRRGARSCSFLRITNEFHTGFLAVITDNFSACPDAAELKPISVSHKHLKKKKKEGHVRAHDNVKTIQMYCRLALDHTFDSGKIGNPESY